MIFTKGLGRRAVVLATAATVSLPAATASAGDDFIFAPIATIAVGPAFHISPDPSSTEFALDANIGFTAIAPTSTKVKPGLFMSGQLGYTRDGIGLHAFNIAAGVGYGLDMAFATYNPRLIVGDMAGNTAIGMRNGITGHFIMDLLSLEIGHQFVDVNGTLVHDVRTMFALNPGMMVAIVVALATWGDRRP